MLSKIKKHPIGTTAIVGGVMLYSSIIANYGWVKVIGSTGIVLMYIALICAFVHMAGGEE